MPNDTKYIVNGAQLTDIGAAIRDKRGEQDTYTVDEMPEKISEIGSGDDFLKLTVTLKNERSSSINIRDFFPTQPASGNILFNVPDMPLVPADFFISNMLGLEDILESGEERVFDFYYAMYNTQPPIIGLAFKSAGNINFENVQNLELVSSQDDMRVMKVVTDSINSAITVKNIDQIK